MHIIYALTAGGLENGLVNIINRSPTERYRHVIICLTTADDFVQRITVPNVQIIEMNMREGHDIRCYWQLRKLLKRLRPDIIHSRNMAALEAQLCSVGLGKIKRVHGEHGREINDLDGRNWKYMQLRRFMRFFIHRYVCVSRDLEAWLATSVGVSIDKIRQIYNGVDHTTFAPSAGESIALLPQQWQQLDNILIIGTVGRLTPVKDQQILLDALAELLTKYPQLKERLRAIIVGDGPLSSTLSAKLDRLALRDIVWMAGERRDVPELLRAMDIFVLPSLGEGISNTVLEAMACGLPVIATAVGGNLELVEQGFNGKLFPARDCHALVDALYDFLVNEEERVRQGKNARERVCSQFNWDETVQSYLGIYDELLERGPINSLKKTG